MVKKTLPTVLLAPVALLILAVTPAARGDDGLGPEAPATEWFDVPWSGGNVRVALVPPADGTSGPHPVLFALPWGGGTEDLVSSFIGRYWATRPARRGYYVVAPAVLGSSLDDTADELIPAIFEWMDAELDYDPTKVALVGASNGGRGMFHAALAEPDRFATLLGLPGRYDGDARALSVLVGKPVWLIVGEFDTGWREASEATVGALESQGVQTRLDVAANQGHVMDLGVQLLLDGLDEAIRR
jgi:dienelactone hydrolase